MNFLNQTVYRPWGSPIPPSVCSLTSDCGRGSGRRRRARTFYPVQSYLNGMGDTQQIVMSAPMIAGATIGAASALGAGWATAAIPIVGPIIAGVTLGLTALFSRKGPKQRVATTEIVNKVEPLLKQNLDGYFSGPRTYSSQAQALANFDAGWQFVVDNCGIPEMGNPGQACINDRKAGACVWKDAQGVCWNWSSGYRDPIANDPEVRPDPMIDTETGGLVDSVGNLFSGITAGGSGTLLLAAGLGIAALAFTGGGKKK